MVYSDMECISGGIKYRSELGYDFITQVETKDSGGSFERQQDPKSEAV